MQTKFSSPKSRLKIKSKYCEKPVDKARYTKGAEQLLRYYVAIREAFGGQQIPFRILKKSWSATTFNRLVEHLKTYEKETGVSINKIEYIRGLFLYYGLSCYPNKLLGPASLAIYRKHRELIGYKVADQSEEASHLGQLEMLEHLSQLRDELPEQILKDFRFFGVFSEGFISYMQNGKS